MRGRRDDAQPPSATRPGDPGPLDRALFDRFAALARARAGLHLTPQKGALLRGRLLRRLRAAGEPTFAAYYERVLVDPDEAAAFVNAVTTNKTSFFREPHHFDALREALAAPRPGGAPRTIWSAGCSTGEEAYSAAMVAASVLDPRGESFRVLATDIDTEVLARGASGIYGEEVLDDVPAMLARQHLRRGVGAHAGEVRVAPRLRAHVRFAPLNFIEFPWPLRARFDVVFCRNALIYFDGEMQRRVVDTLISFVAPGGLLFLGHSEGMLGAHPALTRAGTTVFRVGGGSS